jgi:hypothetical protein
VWQSRYYFPIYELGGAKYWDFKNIAAQSGDAPQTKQPYYDAGAWAGHKDDVKEDAWSLDPHLRWMEMFGTKDNITRDGTEERPFLSGGYNYKDSEYAIDIDGPEKAQTLIMGKLHYQQRANFFVEVSDPKQFRLAVGPRVPETRSLIMNLTLPTAFT